MNKFWILCASLLIIAGCQARVGTGGPASPVAWQQGGKPPVDVDADQGEEEAKAESKTESESESKSPPSESAPVSAKSEPPPPVQPQPASTAPQAGLPAVPLGLPGRPPMAMGALVGGHTRVVTYGPAMWPDTPGYTRWVNNQSDADLLIHSTNGVPLLVVDGQCFDPAGGMSMGCPFVEKFTPEGKPVYLLRAKHQARFVVDIRRCPPTECRIVLEAVPFSATFPYARPAYNKASRRSHEFPYDGRSAITIR